MTDENCAVRGAKIEFSPVWDTSCLAEQIYDLIKREVSQAGEHSIFTFGNSIIDGLSFK